MLRGILIWVGLGLTASGNLHAGTGFKHSAASPPPGSQFRAVLDRYCVTCHNQKLKTAGLLLDKADVENVPAGAPVWEKVILKLRSGAMPPAGLPRPEKQVYDSFASYLETELDRAAAVNPNPGRTASVHRLNRAEYANAIRDLFGIEIDSRALLPADDSGYGFDNVGDVLSVSPMLLERFMSAAVKISRLAVGDAGLRPASETYHVSKLLMQDDRMSESLPFGTRGGMAIRHYFPLDGEYTVKIRLQRDNRTRILGLAETHHLDVLLDGERIKLFTLGGRQNVKSESPYERSSVLYQGDAYLYTADAALEARFSAKAGRRLVGVTFLKQNRALEGERRPHLPGFNLLDNAQSNDDEPNVASVTIVGPYNATGLGETPSRRKIFSCYPGSLSDEEPCARKILSTLARRAYRRPITDADLHPLLHFYRSGRSKGNFEAGIAMAVRRILGPEFLFRIEREPSHHGARGDAAYRISDLELASRLSFFLWSSIPDEELLNLAERGKLRNAAVLEQQVRRMLADTRSQALVENFVGQWLYLRNLRSVSPDPQEFPEFDENLREAFQRETALFFQSMLREDRGVLDLLNAGHTFVNERLARHYGIPGIYGNRFRRVNLNDEARKGLLGQGSVLTATSYPNRTSPVLRGKWILENILGTPPPPPPPNVPSLKDRNEGGKILSMRQQLEQHRANPACATCHVLMDPLGFALENFDAVGKWRTTSGAHDTPIDSSGVLPDGVRFQGAAGLRQVLLNHPEQFAQTITEKLLTYALGRGVEYYDAPAIRKITREAASSNYRWSSLILGIVRSTPFQMRRSREP